MRITTKRRFQALLLLMVLVASVAVRLPGAPDSDAALWNVMPSDSFGAPKGTFYADEALFFSGTSDIDGGWVCIVHASVTNPTAASCDSSAWGTEKRMLGLGTLLGMPLEGPMLKVGQWRLLTADHATKKGIELSDVFTVRSCQGTCDPAPAQAIINQWKIVAGSKSYANGIGCYVGNLKAITNAFNAARGMYALAGGGLMGFLVGGAWGYMGFANDITTEDMALSMYRDVSCGASLMFAGIAADPPDPNFASVADPVIRTLPLTGDAAYDDLLDAYERASGYGTASRVAFERYQGAMAASDDAAAAMQAQAASDFTEPLIQALRDIDRLQPAVEAKPVMAGPTADAATAQASDDYAARVAADGFTPAEITDMQAKGLTASEIDSVRAAIAAYVTSPGFGLDTSTIDPTMSMKSVLEGARADMAATIDAFDQFSRSMSVVAAVLEASIPPIVNHAPVSSFDADSVSGTAPLTVTFTSTATDPDGDPLDLTWDIAGTRQETNVGTVTHTFSAPGSYGVSLVAADPDGEWDQAVRWITVYPEGTDPGTTNQPPVAQFSPRIVDADGPITQTFTSTSSDPDGDPITHTWYFGDGTTMTGASVTKTFPAGYIMSVLLIVSDGELTGQIAGEVTSRNPGNPPDPNTPPVASFTADPPGGTSPLAVTFTSTSTDLDGDPLTHSWDFGDGATGTGATVAHTYTAAGTYTATLVVSDGTVSQSTTRSIVVGAPNQPPVANPQTVDGFQDEPSTITLTGSDPEAGPLAYAVADGPSHGSLSGTAPNLTYTPDAGYFGDDTFTFTTNDGALTSAPATVTVKVKENRPPLAQNQTVGGVVPGVATQFSFYGYDPDSRPLTFAIVGQPGHGSVSGAFPYPWYTPDDSFTDGDSLTYTVSDGVHTSAPATVTFTPDTARPVADALTVQGSQIIDVAENDAPRGARVGDVTDPAHGTVSCSDFGMCLFVADEGYVGSDTFDYTLQVGVNEATTTVTVTIVAPPAGSADKPSAADDVLVTAAGTPGSVDVLANDTGDGTLTVTPSDGEHGTVACAADGRCTYSPSGAGFVGYDVFSYTLSNGTEVDTALVRVRVGNPPEGLTVTSGSSSATPGGVFAWLVRMIDGGPVETGLARSGPVTATASGPHSNVAGSARTADGWTLSTDGDSFTATPGAEALIGDQATSVMARPLPPITQGTGGDGHVPVLVGSKVFAFFHHQNPTQITCTDRATGQLCPDYPKTIPVGTHFNPGPGAVVGTQIWVHLYARNYQTSGLFCWDTASNQTCGMVTNRPGSELWNGTAPLLVDGQLWFATDAGRLRCIDPATGAECAEGPFDTGVTFGGDTGDIVNHGSKVYVSNYTNVNCVDVATGARCDGWPVGGRDLPGNLVRSHSGTTGAVDGVCGVNYWGMNCVRDADPTSVVHNNSGWTFTHTDVSASVEAETGTRTFYGTDIVYVNAGLGCFDWSTMSACTGANFAANGHARLDIAGTVLPQAYGAVWDGSCVVAVGDPGKVFTMDSDGNSPCTSLDSGASPLKADLRLQRFDSQVGSATWDKVRVFDADLTAGEDFTSFLVTVRDGATGEVVASQEMIGTDGILDLSGIDPAEHPSLTVRATSRSVLHTGDDEEEDVWDAAWDDGHAPKVQLLWNADAAPLGFQTKAASCLDGPSSPLVVRSTSGELTARGELTFDSIPPCTPPDTTTTTTPPTTAPPTTSPPTTGAPTTMPPTTAPGSALPGTVSPSTSTPPLALDATVGTDPGGPTAPAPSSTPPEGEPESSLPLTGIGAWRLALLGGLVFLCGAAVVLATRRRRVTR